jgi:hypothetical protein
MKPDFFCCKRWAWIHLSWIIYLQFMFSAADPSLSYTLWETREKACWNLLGQNMPSTTSS